MRESHRLSSSRLMPPLSARISASSAILDRPLIPSAATILGMVDAREEGALSKSGPCVRSRARQGQRVQCADLRGGGKRAVYSLTTSGRSPRGGLASAGKCGKGFPLARKAFRHGWVRPVKKYQ